MRAPLRLRDDPGVSPELDAVFRRMVAKKAQHRYPNVTALIADLERCRIDPCASPTVNLDPTDGRHLKAFLEGMQSASSMRRTATGKSASSSSIIAPPRQLNIPVVGGDTVVSGDSQYTEAEPRR